MGNDNNNRKKSLGHVSSSAPSSLSSSNVQFPVLGQERWSLTNEIHDYKWCPASLRNELTLVLQTLWSLDPFSKASLISRLVPKASSFFTPPHALVYQLLNNVHSLSHDSSESRVVLDLCSGAGGPLPLLASKLHNDQENHRNEVDADWSFILTDLFPNKSASDVVNNGIYGPRVTYHSESVNAARVPEELASKVGIRTLFGSFHHLSPALAKDVLKDTLKHSQPLLIVEATHRTWPAILGNLLFVPLFSFLVPFFFIRPWSWMRLFLFFWPFPIIPLVLAIDGFLSNLRSYSKEEFSKLVNEVNSTNTISPKKLEWEYRRVPVLSDLDSIQSTWAQWTVVRYAWNLIQEMAFPLHVFIVVPKKNPLETD